MSICARFEGASVAGYSVPREGTVGVVLGVGPLRIDATAAQFEGALKVESIEILLKCLSEILKMRMDGAALM